MSSVIGRRRGFADVYDDTVWRIYAFFGYRVGSRSEAEDLTQQTFERALRAWDRFDPGRASVEAWLATIARNLLIDHYRQKPSVAERSLSDGSVSEHALGSEPAVGEDLGLDPELEAALASLDDRSRELVALRYGGDLTGPEIAELTGLSLANVQQILSRALRGMRAELERGTEGATDQPAASGPTPATPRATAASSRPPDAA